MSSFLRSSHFFFPRLCAIFYLRISSSGVFGIAARQKFHEHGGDESVSHAPRTDSPRTDVILHDCAEAVVQDDAALAVEWGSRLLQACEGKSCFSKEGALPELRALVADVRNLAEICSNSAAASTTRVLVGSNAVAASQLQAWERIHACLPRKESSRDPVKKEIRSLKEAESALGEVRLSSSIAKRLNDDEEFHQISTHEFLASAPKHSIQTEPLGADDKIGWFSTLSFLQDGLVRQRRSLRDDEFVSSDGEDASQIRVAGADPPDRKGPSRHPNLRCPATACPDLLKLNAKVRHITRVSCNHALFLTQKFAAEAKPQDREFILARAEGPLHLLLDEKLLCDRSLNERAGRECRTLAAELWTDLRQSQEITSLHPPSGELYVWTAFSRSVREGMVNLHVGW